MKKFLALFISLAVVLTMTAAMGTAVVSADGEAANTVTVTTETELLNEIKAAPTDGTLYTIILGNDIEASGTIEFIADTNVTLKGGYTLKKKSANENLFIKKGNAGTLTIENVTIDMNADVLNKGGAAIQASGGSTVTLTGNAVLKNGLIGTNGYAVVIGGTASTFKMEGNSKITGFKTKADATVTGLITFSYGGNFVMDGGEISGNEIVTRTNVRSGAVMYTNSDSNNMGNG